MVRVHCSERIKNTLTDHAQRMKPDGFAVGFRAEQISHHRLEQDKIPLQPGGRVIVRSASRVHQFAGQELGNPSAPGAKPLQ